MNDIIKQDWELSASLINDIRELINHGRQQAYAAINQAMVKTYWQIGQRIVEEEQAGKERAEYGKQLLIQLSDALTKEFGKGFSVGSLYYYRQFYLTFPEIFATPWRILTWSHYKRLIYVDLVFYNYLLKCFVLVDLKAGKVTHQDVGQMKMYVNIFDREVRPVGDNPTLGIVLASDTNEDIARYLLDKDDNVFMSKYMLVMPTQEELRREIEQQKAIFALQQQEKKDNDI